MIKLIVVPAFLVAILVGVVAGLQYMSGDRADAIRTAEGGIALVARTIKVMAIAVLLAMVAMSGVLIYVFCS